MRRADEGDAAEHRPELVAELLQGRAQHQTAHAVRDHVHLVAAVLRMHLQDQVAQCPGAVAVHLSPVVGEHAMAEVLPGQHRGGERLVGEVDVERLDLVVGIGIARAVGGEAEVVQELAGVEIQPPHAALRHALQHAAHHAGHEHQVGRRAQRQVVVRRGVRLQALQLGERGVAEESAHLVARRGLVEQLETSRRVGGHEFGQWRGHADPFFLASAPISLSVARYRSYLLT